jgi:phosphoglycolate phosphatase-like HAD superfamily hydrolase
MTVFGYAGGHKPEALNNAGAHLVFNDMHQLPKLLKSYCRQPDVV